jgi:hypothetical protein
MTARPLQEIMEAGWAAALEPTEGKIRAMGDFLRAEVAAGRSYLPAGDLVLRAFRQPFADVRVLIVGQDPYPTPGNPVGLSFSVPPEARRLPASMPYRRCGRSGLCRKLPAVSLGLWQNFGDDRPLWQTALTSAAILRRAFDLGVTHFDLANNYGPPYGSRDQLRPAVARGLPALPRRAGHLHQGRLRHVAGAVRRPVGLAQVPAGQPRPVAGRMGLDYVDIFYSHRFDPDTPLEETMGALDTAVTVGQGPVRRDLVLLAGADREAAAILRRWARRC